MKSFWKFALAAVAIGGLIPYSHKKDEETGATVTQALFWRCTKQPDGDTKILIGLHLDSMPLPETDVEVEVAEVDCDEVPVEVL